MTTIREWAVAAAACGVLPASLAARPDIEFTTIGAPGNAAYPLKSPPGYVSVQGRGRVDYEYRMGKYEVTTEQWIEFVNNYTVLGGSWTFFATPVFWGASQDPSYTGPGRRYVVNPNLPNAAMVPVYGITWRESAMFCNWLHNGKGSSLSAIKDGAYDTATFTTNPNGTFNDQLTHNPGAKFWIPTLDEWMKAGHYDPNRYGVGQGGWWEYPHGSDEAPIGGVPGVGQTNAGFSLPSFGHYYIPLGSYPQTLSPWGLLDMTGMTTEHTEFYWPLEGPVDRGSKGAMATSSPATFDRIYMFGFFISPGSTQSAMGLRIAAVIPTSGTVLVFMTGSVYASTRRRRRSC